LVRKQGGKTKSSGIKPPLQHGKKKKAAATTAGDANLD
jgi:hypothetical protein